MFLAMVYICIIKNGDFLLLFRLTSKILCLLTDCKKEKNRKNSFLDFNLLQDLRLVLMLSNCK